MKIACDRSNPFQGFEDDLLRLGELFGAIISISGQRPNAYTKPAKHHQPPWMIPPIVITGRMKPRR
jgi:hypothetical protein